jgi:tRNA threonylcarbamoyladenosine biosynthesis protein TsaB
MLVAALDTATLTLSCALVRLDPGAPPSLVRARREIAGARPGAGEPRGHGGRLPGALSSLLEAEGLRLEDVGAFAVGLGPGSFTGLRIGLATWKGLAYAGRRPIAGVSSLAAMALAAARGAPEGAVLLPLLDARKGEVYAGFYRAVGGGVEAIAPEAALPPAALAGRAAALPGALVFGEGREAYPEPLAALARPWPAGAAPEGPLLLSPDALAVATLAAPGLAGAAYDAQALFALEPHYVRKSEAEVKFPNGIP